MHLATSVYTNQTEQFMSLVSFEWIKFPTSSALHQPRQYGVKKYHNCPPLLKFVSYVVTSLIQTVQLLSQTSFLCQSWWSKTQLAVLHTHQEITNCAEKR